MRCISPQLFLWNIQFEYSLLLEPRTGHLPIPSCSDFYLVPGDGKVSNIGRLVWLHGMIYQVKKACLIIILGDLDVIIPHAHVQRGKVIGPSICRH